MFILTAERRNFITDKSNLSRHRYGASAFYVGQTDDSCGECYAGQKVQKRHSS